MNGSSDRQTNLTGGLEQRSSGTEKSTILSLKPTPNLFSKLRHLSEVFGKLYESILTRGSAPKYPTGLKSLDELTWGVHKQELMIIGARTSHGKSSLAFQIAMNLADLGNKVAYFSLEMSSEQLLERLICNFVGINSRALRHGLATKQIEASKKVIEGYVKDLKMMVDDESGYRFDNIKTICEQMKFDFVFLDYIQMISPKGYGSKLEAIDDYIRGFKDLAKRLNFGGVVVSQVNREGVDNMGLQHLKGSGTLEEHPDTVLLCEWDWKKGIYWVRVDKQRHGELGKVMLTFQPEYFKFVEYVVPLQGPSNELDDIIGR